MLNLFAIKIIVRDIAHNTRLFCKTFDTLTNEVNLVEKELHSLNRQLSVLERDLKDKKQKYEASVQYLQKNRSIEEKPTE